MGIQRVFEVSKKLVKYIQIILQRYQTFRSKYSNRAVNYPNRIVTFCIYLELALLPALRAGTGYV